MTRTKPLSAPLTFICYAFISAIVVLLGGGTVARAAPESFSQVAGEKLPAVVNVSTKQTVKPEQQIPDLPQMPPGSPLERFFQDFLGQVPNARPRELTALGSGFIISPDGYVVTNNHVIENATEITVILQDDTELKAELVGHDPLTDVALLKVSADHPLPAMEWGDSNSLKVGDWVLAIGNPFGLGGTVTAGIISAEARDIHSGPYDDFLQTDAAINRGNSGGPLLSTDGRVVGINTAIFSPTGGNIGIGFAIPASTAKPIVDDLRRNGSVQRGWLGVQLQPISPQIASAMNLPDQKGALVADVQPKGPAAEAGIEPGDVIVDFNGAAVDSGRTLARKVAMTDPGTKAEVTLLRDGARKTETVELGSYPTKEANLSPGAAPPSGSADSQGPRLGLSLAPVTPSARRQLGLGADTDGAIVAGVTPGSTAAEQGFRVGDVILKVGQQDVSGPGDVISAIQGARQDNKKSVLVQIEREHSRLFIGLPLQAKQG